MIRKTCDYYDEDPGEYRFCIKKCTKHFDCEDCEEWKEVSHEADRVYSVLPADPERD